MKTHTPISRFFSCAALLGGLLAAAPATAQPAAPADTRTATVRIDASKVEQHITPWLYGACIEDVNHEIYGGIYDQKIFGESFEEPDATQDLSAFSKYEGVWSVRDGVAAISASRGGKIVYNGVEIGDGIVETDIRFDNERGNMAGMLFRATAPGIGRDRFRGYAVSLSSVGRKVELTKHDNNVTLLAKVDYEFEPYTWNRLSVSMQGPEIEILLNGKSVLKYTDKDPRYFRSGKFGLRDLVADAYFRNIGYKTASGAKTLSFEAPKGVAVSNRWHPIVTGTAETAFVHDALEPFHGSYSQAVEFIAGKGSAGVGNMSLNDWGIAVRKGQTMQGRIYLKAAGLQGPVTIALESADGKRSYVAQQIDGVTGAWQRYDFTLTPSEDDNRARFSVMIDRPGKLWMDMVTLESTGNARYKGLPLRSDIAQAMVDQGLTFLRYGGTMVNVPDYRFKNMIGDRDRRPPYRGHWYWWSTNGFGIEEFLQFAEAAGFTPSFAVNIDETAQDMADMIEYLNGPVTSEWGARRAANGHPEPYGVKYIEIGNEEQILHESRSGYDHYIERFIALHDAMKAKDPNLELINAIDWKPASPEMERVFKALDGKAAYWDFHPWADPMVAGKLAEEKLAEMKRLFHTWNPDTKMKCAIFEENGDTHNIRRTLGHVTLQNAIRRHGDFVLTSCAANALQPYRQNDNSWNQGQIFFTPTQVWGMPPFYAQQMASAHHQPLLVASEVEGTLDVTATRDEASQNLVLHIANIRPENIATKFDASTFGPVKHVRTIALSGKPEEVNTPEQPRRIAPVERQLPAGEIVHLDIEPFSYTILVFEK